ncbi:major facilitator superfamily multidrug transporter Flu1p [[Candida] anglica]
MGILGTNKTEEEHLRSAAGVDESSGARRQSSSSYTGSSAYETADEYDEQSMADEPQQRAAVSSEGIAPGAVTDSVVPTVSPSDDDNSTIQEPTVLRDTESAVNTVEDFEAPELDGEDALNRRYTIERIATHRSIDEDAEAELRHELTKNSTHKSDGPEAVEISSLQWDGPDDKENPQNWPQWRKWHVTFSVAAICLCVSLGSSLYVSGVPELEHHFKISQELAIVGLTLYLIGLAFGPVFAAPLSEMIGRQWIYIVSLPVSMLFTMGIGLAQNIETVLILRFFCGLIASPAMAIAGGSISDIWSPDQIGFAMAMFCLAPFLGPILGPIIGNFAAEYKDWRWTMWVSLMFSGAALPFVLALPETYKPVLLAKRAEKRGIKLVKPEVNSEYVKKVLVFTMLKPMEMLFVEPIVLVFSIYIAFVFAVLFGFFEAFPIIFISVYRMDQGISGLPFIGVGFGLMLGVVFYIYLDKVYYFPKNADGTRGKRDENGNIIWDAPESRLFIGKVGAVCLPISLFWLGWTSRKSVHWIVPTLSGIFFGFGLILIFFTVILYFSMSFPPSSVASALAANNFLRYVLAAVFPLFTVQMYERLHIDWASSLFGFIALALVPVPFVFGIYGAKLRGSSKYGYAAFFKKLAADKAAAAAAAAQATPAPQANDTTSSSEKTAEDGEFAVEKDVSHKA